jgi:biotin carboxylase
VILIVHTTNGSRRRHFAAARAHCSRLALLQAGPTWEAAYVNRVADVDTGDLDACVAAAKALDGAERIEGVITFVEHSVPAAATVAAALGLPFVPTQAALLARDKYRMRRAIADAGVPSPGFGLARSVDEALALGAGLGYPLVIKPLIGGGSMFTRRVDGPAEMRTHFASYQAGAWDSFDYDPLCAEARQRYDDALLVEQYVDGGEISVESLIVDGDTRVVAIHDKPLPMRGPNFEEIYYRTPSRLPADVQETVRGFVSRIHTALGMSLGASHAEFRLPAAGPPVALEVGARIGGGGVYASVLTSTGVDMLAAVIEMARGRTPEIPRRQPRPTGFFMIFAGVEGVVREVCGVEAARADPAVVEVDVYKGPGDEVLVPPRVFQANGHVVTAAESLDAVDSAFDRLREAITFEVEGAVPAS